MRSSSICREAFAALGLAFLLLSQVRTACALDPNRSMSQYIRRRWETGLPKGPVYAISQTTDGYLWIGTETGLTRFDGQDFRLSPSGPSDLPQLRHVLNLLADEDGSLWTALRGLTLLRISNGVVRDALAELGRPDTSVSKMARSPDGSLLMWLLKGEPSAAVVRQGKLETIATPESFSRSPVLALTQTANGEIWVGTRDAGLFRIRGNQSHAIREGLPDLKVNALVSAGDNQLWVATDAGLTRWDGAKLTRTGIPREIDGMQILTMIVDRDDNLWLGTSSRGLVRVNRSGAAFLNHAQSGETYAVTAIFEDREGSIWIGSGNGLEQLRASAFVSYSREEGLPVNEGTPIHVDSQHRVWFAPAGGGLWWFRGERSGSVSLVHDVVYSIAGAENELWVGRQRGGLTWLQWNGESARSRTYTRADGLAQDSVYSVYRCRDGTVWAGTLSGGVTKITHGKLRTYATGNGLISNTIASILETSDGTVWFATPAGLSAFSDNQWRSYGAGNGLRSEDVNCMLEDSGRVLWVGTSRGLSFRVANGFQSAPDRIAPLREQIFGLAEDRQGWLWVATGTHVLRIKRDSLLRGSLHEGDIRSYGLADGLRGVEGVKRHTSVVADSLGRIWFATNKGISAVDPNRLDHSSALPISHVQTVTADGVPAKLAKLAEIPAGSRRVVFAFTGLGLTVPERVRFRYRLDDYDRTWSDPTTSREAPYPNLPPGAYRFRVQASDADSDWAGSEASLDIKVAPFFWQTRWFQASVLGAALLSALAAYRLRLRQMSRRLNLRFEERLAERTRIAQELHDTLLQGFLSVSMQVHVGADMLPQESNAKPILTRALQLMGQVIDEGRNAVRGLRSPLNAPLELEHAFANVQEELMPVSALERIAFRVVVEGKPRPLHPLLRDEVYRIGREALVNAFRHSGAKNIELELGYWRTQLQMRVRDDGRGIDPEVLKSGREGHWGLPGMRERADRIGAQLRIWSAIGGGTDIELSVPGRLAFADYSSAFGRLWQKRTRK